MEDDIHSVFICLILMAIYTTVVYLKLGALSQYGCPVILQKERMGI